MEKPMLTRSNWKEFEQHCLTKTGRADKDLFELAVEYFTFKSTAIDTAARKFYCALQERYAAEDIEQDDIRRFLNRMWLDVQSHKYQQPTSLGSQPIPRDILNDAHRRTRRMIWQAGPQAEDIFGSAYIEKYR